MRGIGPGHQEPPFEIRIGHLMSQQVVGFIFARGGSKGVPRKNIRLLAGRPLISYAIETALATPSIDRVVVSTDDDEIAEVSRACGAEVPFMRPRITGQRQCSRVARMATRYSNSKCRSNLCRHRGFCLCTYYFSLAIARRRRSLYSPYAGRGCRTGFMR
jgi:hypothetical protein